MSIANEIPILVTDHAMWKAAERFRGFDVIFIESEVREALRAGRVTTDRASLGFHDKPDGESLYVWTPRTRRVYALRVDRLGGRRFVVTTAMRRPGKVLG